MSIDPVALRVLGGALRAACEEMGALLIRAAHSSNVKERRDCSCALFDEHADMVMQAEHIPVHLGAMPAAVAAVRDEEHRPGVSWVLNDPYAGGTHLPDITVPVLCFNGTRDELCRRDLMERALQTVRTDWRMHWLEGADHSFHVLKKSGRTDAQVLDEVGDATKEWIDGIGGAPA